MRMHTFEGGIGEHLGWDINTKPGTSEIGCWFFSFLNNLFFSNLLFSPRKYPLSIYVIWSLCHAKQLSFPSAAISVLELIAWAYIRVCKCFVVVQPTRLWPEDIGWSYDSHLINNFLAIAAGCTEDFVRARWTTYITCSSSLDIFFLNRGVNIDRILLLRF